jgi:uncharacterized protein
MKFLTTLLFAVLALPALAQEAKPTAASVRQLFDAMHSSGMVESYLKQVETTMRTALQQATAGQTPNARQKKIVEDLQTRIMALVKEQLNWTDLEPIMIEVYRDTFTQHEIDGMLKFYRSEAGQAVINKLPTATQESMARIQGRVTALTPKLMELEKETAAQIKAAGDAAPAPAPPAPAPPVAAPPEPPRR